MTHPIPHSEDLIARIVLISGRVQGVFYRQSMCQEAQRCGVTGWVQNLPTGQVLAQIYGTDAALESLIAWCHQGPTQAQVQKVVVTPLDALSVPKRFEIRRESA